MGDLRRRLLLSVGSEEEQDCVDLGLPSGTLWCTGNICKDSGGTYYVGQPTEYGCYYSWGNIEGHNKGEGYDFSSSNYNSSPGASLTANIASNDSAHDAALACLGTGKRMPTKEEYQELYDNCTVTWTSNYNGSGIAGRIFKSKKAGYTDKEIFFPAAGYYDGTSLYIRGSYGYYCSSSYYSSRGAYNLYFSSSIVYPQYVDYRYYGFPVRAVKLPSTLFKVTTTDGSSREGITFMLSDGTNTYTYKTDENGEVKVYDLHGTYTISSTYWTLSINSVTLSGQKEVTLTATKTREEFVDLGLSVKWANGNICKSGGSYYVGSPTDKGCYYSWGNIIGHNEGEGYNFNSSTYNGTPGKSLTGNIASNDATHDAALACLGTSKRMPTKAEFNELINNCTSTWVTSYNGVSVKGRVFKSNIAGYTDKEIFIPASGYYNGTSLNSEGSVGYCWSSTYFDREDAYSLFSSSYASMLSYNREYGRSVRAVMEREYVDFGLPSGTLWATMNVGALSETDYGNYYKYGSGAAAGATSTTYYKGTEIPLSPSYDTARQVWKGSWHMPTQTQFEELLVNTTYTWETNFNGSGVNGGKFTSKTDSSKYIFLPAAGSQYEGSQSYVGQQGNYWSSTSSSSSSAYFLIFSSGTKKINSYDRYWGYLVRPVIG